MKQLSQLSPLPIAIAVSVVLHALLLMVRFVDPDAFVMKPSDPSLEVILVNAKHAKAPLKADALAQANLEGGGNADKGRSRSPLPDMRKQEIGDSVKAAQRKVQELEELQKNLMTQNRRSIFNAPPVTEKDKPDPTPTGADNLTTSKAIARTAAEIYQRIEDENKRPRKTFFSPSTRAVGYAEYYTELVKKIEEIGTLNFPQQKGKKLYGKLIVNIPIFQDGSIYSKEGGLRVERSSGNAALDKAALNIVRKSAPFGKFPGKMRSTDKDDVWIIIIGFEFTRDQGLKTEFKGQ